MIRLSSQNLNETEPNMRLSHDAAGRLICTGAAISEAISVVPRRMFPLSQPHQWISLQDSEGIEVACIQSAEDLDKPSWHALQLELTRQEFSPTVTRIVQIVGDAEPMRWHVETDRGTTAFLVAGETDVRAMNDHGVLITDTSGIRYSIPDRRQLDGYSRRMLDWYV